MTSSSRDPTRATAATRPTLAAVRTLLAAMRPAYESGAAHVQAEFLRSMLAQFGREHADADRQLEDALPLVEPRRVLHLRAPVAEPAVIGQLQTLEEQVASTLDRWLSTSEVARTSALHPIVMQRIAMALEHRSWLLVIRSSVAARRWTPRHRPRVAH